jgi:hypothetical protein
VDVAGSDHMPRVRCALEHLNVEGRNEAIRWGRTESVSVHLEAEMPQIGFISVPIVLRLRALQVMQYERYV